MAKRQGRDCPPGEGFSIPVRKEEEGAGGGPGRDDGLADRIATLRRRCPSRRQMSGCDGRPQAAPSRGWSRVDKVEPMDYSGA